MSSQLVPKSRGERGNEVGPNRRELVAACAFAGQMPVLLPVSQLSLAGATMHSMRLPTVGAALTVEVRDSVKALLPPLDARVIALRLDPAAPKRCGFEVVFTGVDDNVLDRLASLASTTGESPAGERGRCGAQERRQYPRVEIELKAQIDLPDGPRDLAVRNISMSGALLETAPKEPPLGVPVGAEVRLVFFDAATPEAITMPARVVRLRNAAASSMAVRFVGLDEQTARRLEGLIVYAAIERGFPDPYRPLPVVDPRVRAPRGRGR